MIDLWLVCPLCPEEFKTQTALRMRQPAGDNQAQRAVSKLEQFAVAYGWKTHDGQFCCRLHFGENTAGWKCVPYKWATTSTKSPE